MEELQKKEYEPTKEEVNLFNKVIQLIEIEGKAVRDAIKEVGMYTDLFYKVKECSSENKEQYARACTERGTCLAEQTIKVIRDVEPLIKVDGRMQQNMIGLQKAAKEAEALRWYASKLNKALSDKADTNINIQNNAETVNVSLGSIDLSLKDDNI